MHWLGLGLHCVPAQLQCWRAHLPRHEKACLLMSTSEHPSRAAAQDTPSGHAEDERHPRHAPPRRLCIRHFDVETRLPFTYRLRSKRHDLTRQQRLVWLPASIPNSERF